MSDEAKAFGKFLDRQAKKTRGGKNCPNCKGRGFVTRKVFCGNDYDDNPVYRDTIDPCHVCLETITRVKRKYR